MKRNIKNDVYKVNEKLPSEYDLSKQLGISRATLREALRVLEEEHIVTRRHGVGTFVNPKPAFSSGIEELNTVTDMIRQAGKVPGAHYISTEIVHATNEDKEKFSSTTTRLGKIERVRTADGKPVVFCIDQVPEGLFPLENLSEYGSIFAAIEHYTGKQIAYAVTYIEPVSFQERIYSILNCEPDQPLLLLKQMHYNTDDEMILYSANYFRSDVFSFHVLRKRT
jgi:GntR family transcriptional regulator